MKWHKGPPPEIGWWPASIVQDHQSIRWWNGEFWSVGALPEDSAEEAAKYATKKSSQRPDWIQWTDRWWL